MRPLLWAPTLRVSHPFSIPRSCLLPRPYTTTQRQDNLEIKYAEKLRRRAAEVGLSVTELKERETERQAKEKLPESEKTHLNASNQRTSIRPPRHSTNPNLVAPSNQARQNDALSLSSILDVSRVISAPHTPTQISSLWIGYHTTRSEGRYICASIPVASYERMIALAQKYPNFVIPLPRDSSGDETEEAYEVYYMQWGFYGSPSPAEGLESPVADTKRSMPPTSTILLTPLQEYKLRESFAMPYLALTFYTELSRTHGLVLLRGEITPGAGDGKLLLRQADAHQLASSIQKFYLAQNPGDAGEKLVRLFHERPEEFNWEELLPHVTLVG